MLDTEVVNTDSAEIAAKRFHAWLEKWAEEAYGNEYNTSNIYLWSPTETKRRGYGSGWCVCWEEGPYEWALSVTAGEGMLNAEFGQYGLSAEGEFASGVTGVNWFAEPYNGFILNFYQD